ncbi:unnamed protein product [Aureobasidium vineae]|uniref:BTB domain-containing protein n=1 Tax=Aureobasidium vineae TaxID=2773715 RepID=A0A9N8P4X2_9PEZI|nr:unnamed protein product [Aureobasidium vineae]
MSASADPPNVLEYRPAFKQRPKDMGPPPPTVTGTVGHLTASAHISLRAAYTHSKTPMDHGADLLKQAELTAEKFNLRERETYIGLGVDAAAFELYTEWVYSGRICKGASTARAKDTDLAFIGQAYILGEKLLDHTFRNAVVDFLLETVVATGSLDLTLPTLIFNETSASAPIRRLLVDLYACYGHKDWLKALVNHNAFLSDLIQMESSVPWANVTLER